MGRRGLCTPAATPQVVHEIREAVADMKAKIEAKPAAGEVYTPETFEADLKSGKVDVSLLSNTLSDFDVTARKVCVPATAHIHAHTTHTTTTYAHAYTVTHEVSCSSALVHQLAMKCVSDMSTMAREKAEEEATMAGYDWSQWERKGLDSAVVSEVRAMMEQGVAAEQQLVPELTKENQLDEMEKEIVQAFKGPGGFLETASAEEKAATAAMLTCISDMEKLEVDAVGLRDVTIAESEQSPPDIHDAPPLPRGPPLPLPRPVAGRRRPLSRATVIPRFPRPPHPPQTTSHQFSHRAGTHQCLTTAPVFVCRSQSSSASPSCAQRSRRRLRTTTGATEPCIEPILIREVGQG